MDTNKVIRTAFKAVSNNQENPNKNICAYEVAKVFGCENNTRYLHTSDDLLRAVRKWFKVRQCNTALKVKAGKTTKWELRDYLKTNVNEEHMAYIVRVKGHVFALCNNGKKLVDTDFIASLNRPIEKVWAVYFPED